jgi:hypothetical protein
MAAASAREGVVTRSPLTDTAQDALHDWHHGHYGEQERHKGFSDSAAFTHCICFGAAYRVAAVVEGEHQRLRDLAAAVGTFLHGPTCDNDDCRDDGYCLRCICALEDAYTRLAPDNPQEGAA